MVLCNKCQVKLDLNDENKLYYIRSKSTKVFLCNKCGKEMSIAKLYKGRKKNIKI